MNRLQCRDRLEKACCCASGPKNAIESVSTSLTFKDMLGAWKVRWGIGRMSYKTTPGLYSVGFPNDMSPVLVSASYKLTFDQLRKELAGFNGWLLILDTKGVNVWCAAGKGTFGTDELVKRIQETSLSEVVSHRTLILPQLGATGVCAQEVKKRSGFSVLYGPVRAMDIKEYLRAGNRATEAMRTVEFTTRDRLVLTPVEIVRAAKKSLTLFGVLFLINLFAVRPFELPDFLAYFGAVLMGTTITPLLLPIIPGRAFSWKGWLMGLLWSVFIVWLNGWFDVDSRLLATGYLLALPALSAYIAMGFTGSSTYTSFSGVTKELKTALPPIVLSLAVGSAFILARHLTR